MPSFGGINCDIINGVSEQGMRELVKTWTVVGVDGHGYQRVGRRGASYELNLVVFDSIVNLLAWAKSIGELQASTVSFLNSLGQTSPAHMVELVGRPLITPAIGENGSYRGEISVQVRAVA